MTIPPSPQKTGGSVRCRQCGARLGRGVEWCSLCLTPTASPEVPAPRAAAEENPAVEVAEPGYRGRHVREGTDGENPVELLAGLAADEHRSADASALTVIRAHLALGQLPGGKYALAFGGGLLLLVALMGGLTLLGLLL